jgi:hypothetical protein
LGPYLNEVDARRKTIEQLANVETMSRIKGRLVKLRHPPPDITGGF